MFARKGKRLNGRERRKKRIFYNGINWIKKLQKINVLRSRMRKEADGYRWNLIKSSLF
ncbi:hypothetical protein HMPREF9413_4436 [Paenibacillus sp. HGF7]|nr:hypothetical protein HMPREF9413_4436 [Paenibacillus sp. HGF7]